jgi:hypothetical protein
VCQNEPDVPAIGYDDKDLGLFILDLKDAGSDCREKLESVKGILDNQNVPTTSP